MDRAILRLLVANGRASLQEIAESVGLRRPSVHERVKKLEASGVIRGYRADVNPTELDAGLVAFVLVEVALGTEGNTDCLKSCEGLAERLRRHPEVLECHTLAGTEDLIVKVRFRDIPALERLVMRDISGLPGVRRVETKIAMRTHFERPLTVPTVSFQRRTRKA